MTCTSSSFPVQFKHVLLSRLWNLLKLEFIVISFLLYIYRRSAGLVFYRDLYNFRWISLVIFFSLSLFPIFNSALTLFTNLCCFFSDLIGSDGEFTGDELIHNNCNCVSGRDGLSESGEISQFDYYISVF